MPQLSPNEKLKLLARIIKSSAPRDHRQLRASLTRIINSTLSYRQNLTAFASTIEAFGLSKTHIGQLVLVTLEKDYSQRRTR